MSPTDYARIERAIRYLDESYPHRPDLGELARTVGLSEFHFQRLFTRWAGISPKRFIQFQTVGHARELLRESRSILAATYEAGLSGPSRLHDLFVTVEAVTPGEYRTGGAGLEIRWGVHQTPFGECLIAATDRGVCHLAFLDQGGLPDAMTELHRRWPRATLVRDPGATTSLARRIFTLGGQDGAAPLALHLKGTNFQLKVWEALLRIPPGAMVSYEDVARMVEAPGAERAVAAAIGRNPVAFLVPCHRVIRKTGAFGGYRWGLPRKRAILTWEAVRARAS
ncbi:MAG TPA: methylated-DNA--[protein]-cysteine S-methyltransferase [Gemmatimonadales bacterium]|nr:methylated-DNA--[protein]-cysteine S-methyltransferase [Gemmatimonadales bacterium]